MKKIIAMYRLINKYNIQYTYLLLFVLNLYLISPVLYDLCAVSSFDSVQDPVIIWSLLISVMYIMLIQFAFKRQFIAHLILLPNYIFVLVDLYLINVYGMRLTSGIMLIYLSNISNSLEYLEVYAPKILTFIIVFVVLYCSCIWKIQGVSFSIKRKYLVIPIAGLLFLYGSMFVRGVMQKENNLYDAFMYVFEHDYSASLGLISQIMVVNDVLNRKEIIVNGRVKFNFNSFLKNELPGPEVYVLVLGESSVKSHWSLYGYNRSTTPNLKLSSNLVVYSNVITEWPLTQRSIPIILTRGTAVDFNRSLEEKSLISAFKESGFKTYWLGLQSFDRFAGDIHVLASDADVVNLFTRKFDGYLLKPLEDLIINAKKNKQKLFIVLHTKGSHFKYSYRYPKKYAIFQDSGKISDTEELINSYDNSVIYTDYFLSKVIDLISDLNIVSTVFYISDHGENLMDDERNLFGHNYSNEYDMPVPMFFWYSKSYEKQYGKKLFSAKSNKSKKITSSNIFYSLLDMANITFKGFDDSMSIFSSELKEGPRIVFDQKKNITFNYDDIFNKGNDSNYFK